MSKGFVLLKGRIEEHHDLKRGTHYTTIVDHPKFKDDADLFVLSYDQKTAKRLLREELENVIRDGLHFRKLKLTIMTTNSGAVVVLWPSEIRENEWIYEVVWDGKPRGSCIFSADNREEAINLCSMYIEQSYGGVKDITYIKLY